jgi:hypothetical protein
VSGPPKLALCMGSLYAPPNELAGTRNDVAAMAAMLVARSFEVTVLFGPDATKANMIAAMTGLVDRIGPRGIGVIYWSGHGTTGPMATPDPNELGPSSEAWCPHDFRSAGMLWDDQLGAILSGIDPDGRGVLISDSCYSQQVSRLAAPITAAPVLRAKFIPYATILAQQFQVAEDDPGLARRLVQAAADRIEAGHPRAVNRPFPWVDLAACQDNQVAWCADIPSGPSGTIARGAFTWALEQALAQQPKTYNELMYGSRRMRGVVGTNRRPGFLPSADLANQTPAMTASVGRARWALLEPSG